MMHIAARLDQEPMLQILLEEKADLNAIDKSGCTPLHVAVKSEACKAVALLLNSGARGDIENSVLTQRRP